jgi:hypothetical protein
MLLSIPFLMDCQSKESKPTTCFSEIFFTNKQKSSKTNELNFSAKTLFSEVKLSL